MKRMFRFSIAILAVAVIVIIACNRKKADYIGPAYIAAPDGFALTTPLTASTASINFKTTPVGVLFNASFSNNVSWTLTLVGLKSGAVHTVSGISNGFTNVAWTGGHDGLFFFRKAETVRATLSFFGSSLTSSKDIVVARDVDLTTCGYFPVWGDFETPAQVVPPTASAWASFNYPTAIPGAQQGIDSVAIDYKGNNIPSVQGKNYYYIKGIGNTANYISGIQFIKFTKGVLPADPENVWVNIYMYGTGDPNANVDLEYQEADLPGDDGYDAQQDDAYVAHVILDHVGWKLFSFKYSDLVVSTNGFGSNGNKVREPNRLRSFDVVLSKKSIPTSPVEVYFDYPIFTVGGPFKPCK